MEILEEIRVQPARHKKSKTARVKSFFNWNEIIRSFIIGLISIGVLGLACLEKNWGMSVASAVESFNWMVLVRGDTLQVDEVGRYLRQLPGAKDVFYISSEEAFSKLQSDPFYFDDLSGFKADDLPPTWRVSWEAAPLDFSLLEVWAADVRQLPSVMNVAFDPNTVVMIKALRMSWYKAKLVISSLLLISSFLLVVLLGRFLFFTDLKTQNFKKLGLIVLQDQIVWSIAGAIMFRLVGPFAWPAWLGGIGLGVLHALWIALEKKS